MYITENTDYLQYIKMVTVRINNFLFEDYQFNSETLLKFSWKSIFCKELIEGLLKRMG